jgi:predicted ArsR family transcriptional regulator
VRDQWLGRHTRERVRVAGEARWRADLSGASRVHVLEALRAADAPLSVTEVADRVGLHPNTVRWHLDQLVEAGWVAAATEPRGGPGRPRLLYTARTDAGGRPAGDGGSEQGYRLLAEILAGYLDDTSPDPRAAASEAGRAWGRYLIGEPARPFTRLSPAQVTRRVTELLDDLGFAPEADLASGQITLHACPFRAVAETHPDVACAVHLGLMQGALAELGATAMTTRLEPFVTPRQCRGQIGLDPAAPAGRPLLPSAGPRPSDPGPTGDNTVQEVSIRG